MKVWVDTSKDSVAVPSIDGQVRIKLLKLPSGVSLKKIKEHVFTPEVPQQAKPEVNIEDSKIPDHKPEPMRHANSTNDIPQKQAEPPIDIPTEVPPQANSNHGGQDDFIDGFEDDYPKANEDTGMDFNIDPSAAFGEPQAEKDDTLLDFGTGADPAPAPAPQPAAENNGFDLGGLGDLGDVNFAEEEKKEEPQYGEDDIRTHVKTIHDEERKHEIEWEEARRKHEQRIEMWKGQQMLNSIKILLCTLHTVMWEGSDWKVMGMDKLSDPSQVKKSYRRAILITHPNKVNQSPTEQKFIANRIFAALNEAWKVFEKTGN